jgi:tRNA threonylcarbamoyladenosine biosynthesis protein TsaE
LILESDGLAISERWEDEAACAECAARLAARPELRSACLTLEGGLGAGKTTFVRYLLRALGVTGRVRSPSYAIVEPYDMADDLGPVWHFDFYRFGDPREWEDAGFREIFASPGLKLVEWPSQATGLLPAVDLELRLEVLPDGSRHVTLRARTPTGLRLLA